MPDPINTNDKQTALLIQSVQDLIKQNQKVLGSTKPTRIDVAGQSTTDSKMLEVLNEIKVFAEKQDLARTELKTDTKLQQKILESISLQSEANREFAIKQARRSNDEDRIRESLRHKDRLDSLKRYDQQRKDEKDFFDLGHKKDRGKKSFLQRLFEARREGSGLLGGITKAAAGSIYEKTLGPAVEEIKYLSGALTGKILTIEHEKWAREKKQEEIDNRERQERAKDLFGYESKLRDKLLEHEIKNEEIKHDLELRNLSLIKNYLYDPNLLKLPQINKPLATITPATNAPNQQELENRSELATEREERFQADEMRYNKESVDALRDIQTIFTQLSDPVSGRKLSVRLTERTSAEKSKKKEEDKGGIFDFFKGLIPSLAKLIPLLGAVASVAGVAAVVASAGKTVYEAIQLREDLKLQQESATKADNAFLKAIQEIDKSNLPEEQKKFKKETLEAGNIKTRLERSKDLRKEYNESWNPLKVAFKNEDMLSEGEEGNLQTKLNTLEKSIKLQESKKKTIKEATTLVEEKKKLSPIDELSQAPSVPQLERIPSETVSVASSDLLSELKEIKILMKQLYGGYEMNAKIDRQKNNSNRLAIAGILQNQTASNVDLSASPRISEFTQNLKT